MTKFPDTVELDDILQKFRLTGRYHVITMILVMLANATNAIYYTNYIFVAEATPYRCKDNATYNGTNDDFLKGPKCSANSSGCNEWTYENPNSFVAEVFTYGGVVDRVATFPNTWLREAMAEIRVILVNGCCLWGPVCLRLQGPVLHNVSFSRRPTLKACVSRLYADATRASKCKDGSSKTDILGELTVVINFGLACQEWKRTLVGTMHSFGYMVGLLIVGPLSDRLGRKSMVAVVGVIGSVLGIIRSFVTNYWLYVTLEFLEAVIGDPCSPIYMLAIEIVATEKRVPFITICGFGFTVGGLLYPLIAWLIPYWRTFLRVVYTPGLLIGFYIFFLDESPRWLLTKGKKDAAVAILEKAAKSNKIELNPEDLKRLTYDEVKGASFATVLSETFKSRAILKRFFVCSVWWIASTFVNHGLTINSVSLQGNKYVNYALLSAIDVPGALIVAYILMKFKRKVPLILTFMTCAVLCVGQPFVPKDMAWLSVFVYMSGKLMSSFYFTITYIFTSELFPTYTRNSMHALCSSIGRIGSIVAPQTPLLLVYWSDLPAVIFGLVSLTAGLLTLLVPDTADNSLPDTVCQAEAIGNKLEENYNLKNRKNSRL